MQTSEFKSLSEGERVSFTVGQGKKGLRAEEVEVI
ncbi:cold-shock protein [Legionella sp. CNM-1927-20]